MKKFILAFLAFALSFCCAFSMIACGDSENSGNSGNTENSGDTGNSGNKGDSGNTDDKGSSGGDKTEAVTEVTADEWEQILSGVDNFTVEVSVDGATQTMKMDGAKRLLDVNMVDISITIILSKEGDSYFQYYYDDSSWSKSYMSEEMMYSYNYQKQLVSMFKDDFESFTYSDGKYTCLSLDKRSEMDSYLTNIEIAFKDGELVSIVYDADDEYTTYRYEYFDIGTTVIELPTDYIDSTTDSTPAVAGKTFVFYAFEGEGDEIDEETKAMVENSLKDAYYTFGSDGSVTAYKSNFVISDNAKYQQGGNEIRMYTYPDEYPNYYRSFTYNGDEIFYEVKVEGITARYIYRLQTSD